MRAIIIGGGIIGLSSAWFLQEAGWEVVVLEKGDLSDNCSFGNMGYLSPSHFVPLAAPGIVEQGLLWMFDSKSPFYVRPELNPDLLRWGLRFVRHANKGHVERSARPLLDLLRLSKNLFVDWSKAMDFGLEQRGCVMYYQTPAAEKEEKENAHKGRAMGLDVEILDREQAQALEPALQPDVRGAVWFKDDAHLHPDTLMRQLQQKLEARGVRILRNTAVSGFERRDGQIKAVRAGAERHEADLVVLAAGSWSPQLARLAGERIDLMPGKGYSLTVDTREPKLNYPCILLEAKVALTPWPGRLRIGSTMEIGAINDRILFPRVQGILEAVPRFLPGFRNDPAFQSMADYDSLRKHLREKVWFGFRPVSKDGLPYIGFAKNNRNLLMATGHAMLGISMGAGTGKLVAEIAVGKETSIPVEAFRPER